MQNIPEIPNIPTEIVGDARSAIKRDPHTNFLYELLLKLILLLFLFLITLALYSGITAFLTQLKLSKPDIIAIFLVTFFIFVIFIKHLRNVFKHGVQR